MSDNPYIDFSPFDTSNPSTPPDSTPSPPATSGGLSGFFDDITKFFEGAGNVIKAVGTDAGLVKGIGGSNSGGGGGGGGGSFYAGGSGAGSVSAPSLFGGGGLMLLILAVILIFFLLKK